MKIKDIAIFGAGGFGLEVAMLIEQINAIEPQWKLIGFFDDADGLEPEINGYPLLGNLSTLNRWDEDLCVAFGLGISKTRQQVVDKIANSRVVYPTLTHPSVIMGNPEYVEIGEGGIICAGTIITTNIRIGRHVVLNLACTVGHETEIGDFCSFMPTCNISGEVKIGKATYWGTGAKIINNITVGENAIIGAGAVVTSDIPSNVTAVGVPAKIIKSNKSTVVVDEASNTYVKNGYKKEDELKNTDQRFGKWRYPDIKEGVPTKYNWVVQHVDNFILGHKTDIGAYTYINAKFGVVLEDLVQIGAHCAIYSISTIDDKKGKVHLKKNARIGAHSVVMPGVTIGENAVVSALSFVTTDIPDNATAVGVPAKVTRINASS
jgi:sugar O-acyltransferase (sialic acid O-acetyltransferase NeuD family)